MKNEQMTSNIPFLTIFSNHLNLFSLQVIFQVAKSSVVHYIIIISASTP